VISTFRPENTKLTEGIKESFLLMRQLKIDCRRDNDTLTKRVMEGNALMTL
jgi:hypothetical protein